MLRRFVLGVCLVCLTLAAGRAEEPSPFCELPRIGHPPDIWSTETPSTAPEAAPGWLSAQTADAENGQRRDLLRGVSPTTWEPKQELPRSERDFLARQRWARLPSFQIFEDPLPSPMTLARSGICVAPCCQEATDAHGLKPRYDVAQAAPAVATVSDETAAPAFSELTVPAPLADPAAMVIELFEKLQAAEGRASEARRRLAVAEAELAAQRQVPTAAPAGFSAAPAVVVTLQMQCFEIDLDAVAESDVELTGICQQELSRNGLAALVARGAFAECCSSEACAAEHRACPCTTCGECGATESAPVAAAPSAPATAACRGESHQFVEDAERLTALVDQLKSAGLLRHVSHPRLMTRSGESARMTVSRQIAYRSAGVDGDLVEQQVSFCDAGTEIEVRPVVVPGPDGRVVQVDLRAQWSEMDETALRETGLPVCEQRTVQSIVELPAGRTAVVAALVEGEDQTGADEPGARGRREFVVLITPRLALPLASQPEGDARR
jgi:hypothetical protein